MGVTFFIVKYNKELLNYLNYNNNNGKQKCLLSLYDKLTYPTLTAGGRRKSVIY